MKLSVVIPVYNEKNTIGKVLKKVLSRREVKEIIVVDDASFDGTRNILKKFLKNKKIKVIFHKFNKGKGAAVKTALNKVTGDYIIIQDADLEYDPADYPKLIRPIKEKKAKVVYGSRFTGERRNMFFWHMLANKMLTLITNILYDTTLSDMETCYKLIPVFLLKKINLRSQRFDFEPEVTAKILKNGFRIYEVPISYAGREYFEGKKIGLKDGFIAFWALLWYRFFD